MTTAEVWLPLSKGKVTVIDFDDFAQVRDLKWHASESGNTFYAERNVPYGTKQRRVKLHREIMQPPPSMEIDHIDRDGLNNRRSNLRIVTRQQNMLNKGLRTNKTSRFRGVSRRGQKWNVEIQAFGKGFRIGRFDNETDAARAYDAAAIKYHGDYASLNFPITRPT